MKYLSESFVVACMEHARLLQKLDSFLLLLRIQNHVQDLKVRLCLNTGKRRDHGTEPLCSGPRATRTRRRLPQIAKSAAPEVFSGTNNMESLE